MEHDYAVKSHFKNICDAVGKIPGQECKRQELMHNRSATALDVFKTCHRELDVTEHKWKALLESRDPRLLN